MRNKAIKVSVALTLLASAVINSALAATPGVAVAPQYDTSHVYVAPVDVERFAQSFLATFGGKSTPQVVVNVLPVPSSTTSQLLQTPAGTVSLFGFTTPVPHPFGQERNGYLVKDMDVALKAARDNGADVIVSDFPDPIGRDAVVQWPGGVNMQLYWHTKTPDYAAFETVPENRVYVSNDSAERFIKAFLGFSHGKVVSDDKHAPAVDVGQAGGTYRRVEIESPFGRMAVLVTNGQLPYPFGHDTTGYQVNDLAATLGKATGSGAKVLVPAFDSKGRRSALVEFPGGYVAEIHQLTAAK
ncbi:glyoxalase [Pseudomonas fluorescens]|uniref:VOC family protein n=1 Tax=Pseudomonas TaxID=286 RepID=UPI0010BFEC5D|nr:MULTISPECIES: glyoxalase [Pseudomonas]MBD8099738.1 glyoxalase [Pseudomonas fluorescens]MBD8776544.1 glyoxalase [Pseudomonas fluorescens]MBD8782507.1 glyoxalase [Pseudomonas fluorescens]MBD8798230.1 glyoxalase [Pseudomonas fluorescens]TKK30024.1 glyoxalase [Pseudomonas sp. CFBP13528]